MLYYQSALQFNLTTQFNLTIHDPIQFRNKRTSRLFWRFTPLRTALRGASPLNSIAHLN